MPSFNKRIAEAFDVGVWKLEGKPRERFTATPELHTEMIRLLGAVPLHGEVSAVGLADLSDTKAATARSVLFSYKSNITGDCHGQTTRYNEIDLRFIQGLRVEDRELELVSIFHTEDLDLLKYPELVGGRHVRAWGRGRLLHEAPAFDSIAEAQEAVEELCPATPEGMATVLSTHFVVDQDSMPLAQV